MTKSEKVLAMIAKLQMLDEKSLDKVENAVNACVIVQNLQQQVKTETV